VVMTRSIGSPLFMLDEATLHRVHHLSMYILGVEHNEIIVIQFYLRLRAALNCRRSVLPRASVSPSCG
jgi:hypothetical protein